MEPYMPFIWIGFAIVMAVCEASTTQLVSLWFVLGAVAAAISTIFTPSIFVQLVVFLVVSAASLAIKYKKKSGVVMALDTFDEGIALGGLRSKREIKVLGETWSAQSEITPVEVGAKVEVLEIEGVRLIVEEME